MLALVQNLKPAYPEIAELLKSIAQDYFPKIEASKLKVRSLDPNISLGELKEYERKEYDENTDREVIKLVKNNAKLRESFINHEKVKAQVADYFSDLGFSVKRDKHLDLFVKKGKSSVIIEVKSCRDSNVDQQVKLGVAQLTYYSYLYEEKLGKHRCCLALQYIPPDSLLRYIVDHCGFDLAYISGGSVVYHRGCD